MDITRNWRLKISRSRMLATRCPETGMVVLPQQTASALRQDVKPYVFSHRQSDLVEDGADYVRAAR